MLAVADSFVFVGSTGSSVELALDVSFVEGDAVLGSVSDSFFSSSVSSCCEGITGGALGVVYVSFVSS